VDKLVVCPFSVQFTPTPVVKLDPFNVSANPELPAGTEVALREVIRGSVVIHNNVGELLRHIMPPEMLELLDGSFAIVEPATFMVSTVTELKLTPAVRSDPISRYEK